MSSEMFAYQNSIFTDPFFAFTDTSSIDTHLHLPSEVFQEIQQDKDTDSIQENDKKNPVDEANILDEIASVLLSSSPSSFKLENLPLTQLGDDGHSSVLGVKTEECGLKFDANVFLPQNIDESAAKYLHRSYSSNSFENNDPNSSFRARFSGVLESQNLQNQMLSPPASSSIFGSGEMRRDCSTGDLQNLQVNSMPKTNMLCSSPLSSDRSLMEEANFKVGRYSAEERKERIDRYRAKRTQRNFNKTIKYACRKTLADNRLRIRGRFARNDESGDIPKASMLHRYEDADFFWDDRFLDEEFTRRSFFNGYDATLYRDYRHLQPPITYKL